MSQHCQAGCSLHAKPAKRAWDIERDNRSSTPLHALPGAYTTTLFTITFPIGFVMHSVITINANSQQTRGITPNYIRV